MQAGQDESRFWAQTPKSYEAVLSGYRARLKEEQEDRLQLAWETAALTGAAMAGKLKPLSQYRKRGNGPQKPHEMLAALKGFQAKGAKMTITRIRMDDR